MARTISEIKSAICTEWMRNEDVARAYGFEVGDSFGDKFSVVSVENLLFYIVAVASWVVERLIDVHKSEVDAALDALTPHRAKWYRDKTLGFLKGKTLYGETDKYDTSDMTESEIEAARVVKYAAVSENASSSILTIKVAGISGGRRAALDAATAQQLENYLREVKDAGVRINLINESADRFKCSLSICYDGLLEATSVAEAVLAAVQEYVENLPFNGMYSNMALVDAVQKVEGVKIAEVSCSAIMANGSDSWTDIDVRVVPSSGYMSAASSDVTITMEEYV
jgi:hypothetical protein